MNQLKEIFVDNFAGGGGASTGFELATGRAIDIAINHDPVAIAMHKANHPQTTHYCESVWDVDPVKACAGRPVGMAWFSPDCKHFSKAKGGKPVDKNIRGLAWIVLRWAGKVRPRVIILENVEEFQTWGPVRKGRPVKALSGTTFKKWKEQLEALGYVVEHCELMACDFGAPTIRNRFFLVARCDGQPITWPKPTHGKPGSKDVVSGKLLPWRTAAEVIDWSIPCKSIFGRKKPLAEKTMQRIARGTDKFVIKCDKPFIINYKFGNEPESVNKPLSTVTGINNHYAVTPVITSIGQNGRAKNDRSRSIESPLNTIVGKNEHLLVAPSLIQYHSEQAKENVRGQAMQEPLMTVDGSNRYALTGAFFTKYYKSGENNTPANESLHTITVKDRMALVESHLSVLRNGYDCCGLSEPLNTVTAAGKHFAQIKTYLTKYKPGTDMHHWPQVREMLNKYCGYLMADDEVFILEINGDAHFISDIAMRMLEPKELFAAQGFPPDYIINFDIETKKGQKIRQGGQISLDDLGLTDGWWQEKSAYTKAAQTARAGNSVCPDVAKAIVSANLPEYAVDGISTMAELKNRIAI